MKKTILKMTATITFVLLIGFNITTSLNNTNFSLSGLQALAYGSGGLACMYVSHNGWHGKLSGCTTSSHTYSGSGGAGTGISIGGSYSYTTSETVCTYKTYDPYNVGYDQEVREYNSALVQRC